MTWTHTTRGRALDLLDPKPDDVDLDEVALSLGNQCRYNGCVRRFYCPTPDQRVLTADLRWVPAGDLRVGEELLAFDEEPVEPGQAGNLRRRFKHGRVLAHMPVRRRVVRLEMANGKTVRASEEHPWLVATKQSRNQKWMTAGKIRDDLLLGRRRFMHEFVEPWSFDATREAGWLAGIFDGEGHLAQRTGSKAGGMQLGVAQLPGLVLDGLRGGLLSRGYALGEHVQGHNGVVTMQVRGGWCEALRLLGSVRPVRLVDKFVSRLRDGNFWKQLNGTGEPAEIVRAYDEGEEWVAGIETSTRTYLCEGFGAHNSVAEHSVLIAEWLEDQEQFRRVVLGGLLHDAAEAYTGDITWPVQAVLFDGPPGSGSRTVRERYKALQARLDGLIVAKVNAAAGREVVTVADLHCAAVKAADLRILLDERRALLTEPPPRPWEIEQPPFSYAPLGIEVQGWDPFYAGKMWAKTLDRLLR